MSNFITVDLNGTLDCVVNVESKIQALGFRSCLFQHSDKWLFGAQALATARHYKIEDSLVDACDALHSLSISNEKSSIEPDALSTALWQLVDDETRRTGSPVNIALIIPDGKHLGTPEVQMYTGKTPLEKLYNSIEQTRPTNLATSKIEFIWRSVATLQSVIDRGELKDYPNEVLVINLNRKTYWTILEFRDWESKQDGTTNRLIDRKPVMDNCKKKEALTYLRMKTVMEVLNQTKLDLKKVCKWTRLPEIFASGMSRESLAELGIDVNDIEHRSWPVSSAMWVRTSSMPSFKWPEHELPATLKNKILQIRNKNWNRTIPIVIESPFGFEMTREVEKSIKKIDANFEIFHVTLTDVALTSVNLVNKLGRNSDVPAWLDHVPAVEIEVRTGRDKQSSDTVWKTVVSGQEAIPAGEMYHSKQNEDRRINLAPGTECIHLHLRRGFEGKWDERYTEFKIHPSDHNRVVEPMVRVRPLSGEARIEILEHNRDGSSSVLAGSQASIKWSDMITNCPRAITSIPELYIFNASEQGWNSLEDLLIKIIESSSDERIQLREELYKCLQGQWKDRVFPLGSDGQPPRSPRVTQCQEELLAETTNILLADLQQFINGQIQLKVGAVNRLHMPLTWLFTGCPNQTVDILLDAVVNPNGKVGTRLCIKKNVYSEWSIYSGIGRTARNEHTFRTIYDTLILRWEEHGGESQDKFLLASVTHPMARRVGVRTVLNESRKRFDRVKRFLNKQLDNIVQRRFDKRLNNRDQRYLELRYVTMGYRGLCQVRYDNPDWFLEDSEETRRIFADLQKAKEVGGEFEKSLVEKSVPYLIGEGIDPTMPAGF